MPDCKPSTVLHHSDAEVQTTDEPPPLEEVEDDDIRDVVRLEPILHILHFPVSREFRSHQIVNSIDFLVAARLEWYAYAAAVTLMLGVKLPVTIAWEPSDFTVVLVWMTRRGVSDDGDIDPYMLARYHVSGGNPGSLGLRIAALGCALAGHTAGTDAQERPIMPSSVIHRIAIHQHADDQTSGIVSFKDSFRGAFRHVSENCATYATFSTRQIDGHNVTLTGIRWPDEVSGIVTAMVEGMEE